MKKAFFCILTSSIMLGSATAQDLVAVPVHGQPVWQQVLSTPASPGAPIAVQSLKTNQVIGSLPVDSSFLSFGTNGQIVTLAYNGEIGYVPAVAVTRLHPKAVKPKLNPAGPNTLEELAQAYEDKVTGEAKVSLSNSSDQVGNNNSQMFPGAQGAVPGALGVGYGGGNGVTPYGGQPGAALATGGVQGIGQIVNGPMPGYQGK